MSTLGRFLRLWLVLAFSYALLRFLFNLGVRGFIILSPRFIDELIYVPLLQAAIFWVLAEVLRGQRPAATGTHPLAPER